MTEATTALGFQDLNAFLHFGYLPRPDPAFLEPLMQDLAGFRADQRFWQRCDDESERRTYGIRLLSEVFGQLMPSEHTLHVVPLSGGLDSRAILAQLLDLGIGNDIVAVTYGVPGLRDYEIAQAVAREAGVRHELFDLSKLHVSEADLEFAVRTGGAWTCLVSTFFNRLAYREYGDGALYWTGFLGDPVAGSHYRPDHEHLSWNVARSTFVTKEGKAARTKTVLHREFAPESVLPNEPYIADSSILNYFEQLDLTIRQASYIRPTLVGTIPTRTPFAEPRWISFFLAQPASCRKGQSLHRRMLTDRFPRLFRLPVKRGGTDRARRLVLNAVNQVRGTALKLLHAKSRRFRRGLNYLDFDAAYRWRPDFIAVAETAAVQLRTRQVVPWCDPVRILDLHRRGVDDHSDSLQALVSLYYNLLGETWRR